MTAERMTWSAVWRARPRNALLLATAIMFAGLAAVIPAPQNLLTPARASVPTPLATGSSSGIAHNVVISPHGAWHAVLVSRGTTSGEHFLVSSDGTTWSSVTVPVASATVGAFAVSDSGELYAGTTTSGGTNAYWRYVSGAWSSMALPNTCVNMPSTPMAIVTDNSNLFVISSFNSCGVPSIFKSTNDGANWTSHALQHGSQSTFVQAVLIDGVVHILGISASYLVFDERWDVVTGNALTVSAPPNSPPFQWAPYMFALPGTPSTVYVAAIDRSGGLYVYKSADDGNTWVTTVVADPLPSEFGNASAFCSIACTPVGFAMGSDGRIDLIGASYSAGNTTIVEVTHDPNTSGSWSAVTQLATVPGNSASVATWPTQQVDGTQPNAVDAWVSVPHGSGSYDLYWYTTAGTIVVPPALTTALTTPSSTVRANIALSTQLNPASVAVSDAHAWQAALVTDAATSNQLILRSQDGVTWSVLGTPVSTNISAIAVADTGEIYAVIPGGGPGGTSVYRYQAGRWFGPIVFASSGCGGVTCSPAAIERIGSDLISIQSGTGVISYSTDDGNTWIDYPRISGFTTDVRSPGSTSVGSTWHVVTTNGSGYSYYARWSRTSRAPLPIATPPVIPAGFAQPILLPVRTNDDELWLSYFTGDHKIGLAHTTDNGNNWSTVDTGSPLPTGFTARTAALGDNGRLYVYGYTTQSATNVVRIDRGLNSSADWSAATVIDSNLGTSTTPYAAIPGMATQAAPPDVWALGVTPGSNPPTLVLHHYGTLGGPAPIPAAQTYGPPTAPSVFAMRPVSSLSDPVTSATGSFSDQVTDAALPAVGEPLTMTRTYNSADNTTGALGRGWTFNYDTKLTVTSSNATLHAGDGQQVVYTRNGDGTFAAPPGGLAALVKHSDGTYTVTTKQREHY
jgi:hypothetical protein